MKQNVNVRIETKILQIVNRCAGVVFVEMLHRLFFYAINHIGFICQYVDKSVDNPVEKPVNSK